MVLESSQQLVDQWVATWVHLRGIEVSDVGGWPLVHVGSATRETELVCLDPGVDVWPDLLRHVIGDRRAMLTVAAPDVGPYLATRLPRGVRLDRDDETLMSALLVDRPASVLPAHLTSRWEVGGRRTTYTVESDDAVAAVGTVGVLGRVVTFDRVETTPAFQRRGLGRHVMASLTGHAIERGATHGVLAASAAGRKLYTTLGWQTRLQLISVMGD
jgi:GNAT superfamily N-acetyltransferase